MFLCIKSLKLFFDSGCSFKAGGRLKLGRSTMDAYTTFLNTRASSVENVIHTDQIHVFFNAFEGSHWRYITIFWENKIPWPILNEYIKKELTVTFRGPMQNPWLFLLKVFQFSTTVSADYQLAATPTTYFYLNPKHTGGRAIKSWVSPCSYNTCIHTLLTDIRKQNSFFPWNR